MNYSEFGYFLWLLNTCNVIAPPIAAAMAPMQRLVILPLEPKSIDIPAIKISIPNKPNRLIRILPLFHGRIEASSIFKNINIFENKYRRTAAKCQEVNNLGSNGICAFGLFVRGKPR